LAAGARLRLGERWRNADTETKNAQPDNGGTWKLTRHEKTLPEV